MILFVMIFGPIALIVLLALMFLGLGACLISLIVALWQLALSIGGAVWYLLVELPQDLAEKLADRWEAHQLIKEQQRDHKD